MSAPVLEILDGGIVAPISRFDLARGGARGQFDGGVYRADGTISIVALQEKVAYDNVPAEIAPMVEEAMVPGRHLFGGLMQTGHFGHFVAECLTRMWAARYVDGIDSTVFIPRRTGAKVPGYADSLLGLLGIPGPIIVVDRPMAYERLVVPSQLGRAGSGFIWGDPITAELLAPLREIAPAPHRKIYVSRAGLKPTDGGILLEQELERLLADDGYHIVRPEQYSLAEQFSLYNGAEKLIFADGSAVHVYALCTVPSQNVAIIWRRKASSTFLNQIESFGGKRPTSITALLRQWTPQVGFGAAAQSRGELDFPALHVALAEAGFVDGSAWDAISEDRVSEEIARLSDLTGFVYSTD